MTHAANAPGWPIVRGVQTLKEVQVLTMRQEAAAVSLSKLWADTFLTNAGIDAVNSTGYTYRGSANYDVILQAAANPDTQLTENASDEVFSNIAGSLHGWAAIFTAGSSYTMSGFIFKLFKVGSPTVIGRAALYATAAGAPTGAPLAQVSFDASLFQGSATNETFTFGTPYAVTSGVTYALVIEYVSGSFDGSNRVGIRTNTGITSAAKKNGSDVWSAGSTQQPYYQTIQPAASSADIRSVQALNLSAAVTSLMPFFNVTIGTGTATYYVSMNDGSSWTAISAAQINTLVGGLPSGTQIRLRVVLTGDAQLEDWGVAA